jgi:dsRNA-specific ribonuclease
MRNHGLNFDENEGLILQAFTHSSFKDHHLMVGVKDEIRKKLEFFNYETLEHLGDTIVNLALIMKCYEDTLLRKKLWHELFYSSSELHNLKAFLASNQYLTFHLFDKYYFSVLSPEPKVREQSPFPLLVN